MREINVPEYVKRVFQWYTNDWEQKRNEEGNQEFPATANLRDNLHFLFRSLFLANSINVKESSETDNSNSYKIRSLCNISTKQSNANNF
jgi:hypothetical protein